MASSSLNSPLRAENPEVYYSDAPIVVTAGADIATLKEIAKKNPRLRSRLCTHTSPASSLHEMLILHHREVYVRPHRHIAKSESFHVIEGDALAVMFSEDGTIDNVIAMGPYESGKPFYYRMPERVYHSLVITSEWLVFHETTSGPFAPEHTEFPAWAPDGKNVVATKAFMTVLAKSATEFLTSRSAS